MTPVEKKAEYDRLYRIKNREKLDLADKLYNQSPAGRAVQKRAREKRKDYCREYNKQPIQRKKETERRNLRLYKNKTKTCLECQNNLSVTLFTFYSSFPDDRLHLCKECEKKISLVTGVTTRDVINVILNRKYTKLTSEDITQNPYLIESNRYLIALKRLIK